MCKKMLLLVAMPLFEKCLSIYIKAKGRTLGFENSKNLKLKNLFILILNAF